MAATKLRVFQDALRHLADARLVTIVDDVESQYALSDAWDEAVAFVLRAAPWRFALVEKDLASGAASFPGYGWGFFYPSDWLRTHAIFQRGDQSGREYPCDLRDMNGVISSSVGPSLTMRYISNTYLDPAVGFWPEHFSQALAAYLAFLVAEKVTGERGAAGRMSQLFNQLLGEAIRVEAEPEDEWLPFQRNGEFLRGITDFLQRGFWRFALQDTTLSISTGSPAAGFAFAYAQPDDWLRTHKLFIAAPDGRECPIDVREMGGLWHTDAAVFTARYVSRQLGFDSTKWDEPFRTAFLAFLQAGRPQEPQRRDAQSAQSGQQDRQDQAPQWERLLAQALAVSSEPPDPLLVHQLDGSFLRGARDVLSEAAWRFALKTGDANLGGALISGYAFAFVQPTDWVRTHKLYVADVGMEHPIDVREQGGHWYSNSPGFTTRYVSTDGLDSLIWPEPFTEALRAYYRHRDAAPDANKDTLLGYREAVATAARLYAEPENKWLPFQLSGEMLAGARDLLGRGFWRFAMTDIAPSVETGTPASGFTHSFAQPADWFNTHKIFISTTDGRDHPIDVREQNGYWSTNVTAFRVRYVSSARGLDSRYWEGPFRTALLMYLEAGRPHMAAANDGGQPDDQRQAAPWERALAQALAACSDTPNEWLPHQFSGAMIRGARDLLKQGFWRFAITTSGTLVGTSPAPDFSHVFTVPDDHLRTHSAFIVAHNTRAPFDLREVGGAWLANVATFTVRYVSTTRGLDTTRWPEPFMAALLTLLEVGREAPQNAPQGAQNPIPLYQQALVAALAAESEEPDRWLPYQFSGWFERARHLVLQEGYWAYRDADGVMVGLKERQYSFLADQVATQPDYVFPYRFPLPTDHFKTHALFIPFDGQECPINISETAHDWSTDAESFVARYVSTDVLDPTRWPELISKAVLAWLDWHHAPPQEAATRAQEYVVALSNAKKAYSREEDDWLRFQFDGSFAAGRKELLEKGRWRFAIKSVSLTENTDPLPSEESTGTVSDSYLFRHLLPNDWMRTVQVYYLRGIAPYAERFDIDYRDEQGAIHAGYTPITIRYVSRMGLDSTKWPAHFRDALLAWLQYREARGDPAKTPIAQAKLAAYELACGEAERLDDARDRPAVIRSSFVAARRGRSPLARQYGWYPPQ